MARSNSRNDIAAEIKTYILEKKKYMLGGHFEDPAMVFHTGQMELRVVAEDLTRQMRYQLDMFFMGSTKDEVSEKRSSIKTELVPESWWDAVKARFFPKLMKERIKYRTIGTEIIYTTIVRRTYVCPHLPTRPQDDHLRFAIGLEPLTKEYPSMRDDINRNEMMYDNRTREQVR